MSACTLIAVGAVVVLNAPAAATAKLIPGKHLVKQVSTELTKHPAKRVSAQVTKREVTPPRVLCICNPHPVPPPTLYYDCSPPVPDDWGGYPIRPTYCEVTSEALSTAPATGT
jgi:hypothetical protein